MSPIASPRGDAEPSDLVRSWLAVEAEVHRSQAAALRELNAACNCSASSGRLSEWLSGRRTPSPRQQRYMVERCLLSVVAVMLADCGASPRTISRIKHGSLSRAARALVVKDRTRRKNRHVSALRSTHPAA
jgi:hypothetical protein